VFLVGGTIVFVHGFSVPYYLWDQNSASWQAQDSAFSVTIFMAVEFHPIEDSAHVPYYENPKIVNPILINFLKKN
jgi:pimeloyl-ACP methyl ester carboxylesterase